MTRDDIDAPIMPTGSGVADLKIGREQDALAAEQDFNTEPVPNDDKDTPTRIESEAHPS